MKKSRENSITLDLPFPKNRPFDIVGIGRNSWDRIALLAQFPAPDTKTEAIQMDNQPGGQVATTLVTAARLGLRASYLGKFGDDAGGRAVRGALVREGIDLSESKVVPGVANQAAFIAVDQAAKTRTVFSFADPRLKLNSDDFSHEAITSGRILYLGARSPLDVLPFAKTARESKCIVAIDADHATDGIQELIALAHIVICPEEFIKTIGIEIGKLAEMGPTMVCSTRGVLGCTAVVGKETFEVPSFPVEVIDTTGAGDVFQGALLASLFEQLPVKEALRYANAVASMKCQTLGGQRGIPTRAEVKTFLASQKD